VSSSGSVPAEVVGACDSVVLVCAPPLLLTVTPVPTWVVDDVAPGVPLVPVVVVALPVDVEPVVVDVDSAPAGSLDEVTVPVADVVDVADAAEPVEDSADEAPVSAEGLVSADATPKPYPVDTAATSQAATASPP
jgi:hypothetical protein